MLVADDCPVSRRVAQRMLETLGCQVEVATTGAEAVTRCQRGLYDLVLMDLRMPGMGGLTATARIRGQGSGRRVPIVAMTGDGAGEDRERCLGADMDDHVVKPVELKTLARLLERWVAAATAHDKDAAAMDRVQPTRGRGR